MAGIYIHIPFCKQACHYCNFYFSTSLGNKESFLRALRREIELSMDFLGGEQIETLYFGGGTPSQLSIDDLLPLIEKLNALYDLGHIKEFTIEANPDDLNEQKVKELGRLREFGFNRFSIGVQSFFNEDLQYMNRAHNAEEGLTAVKRVQQAGYENITIDLIYGTPTLPDDNWKRNLEIAVGLNVPHISAYALTVEPRTTLERKIRDGESDPVEEEQSARQFTSLMKEMQSAGYEQYEISNFARPAKYAIHNSNYWLGKKYLGLGPSAHSFNGSIRRWNVANNINYINALNNGKMSFEEEVLTVSQMANERIMTALRTQWGLSIQENDRHFAGLGLQFAERVMENLKGIDPSHYFLENGILRLTMQGKLFADAIAAKLFIDKM